MCKKRKVLPLKNLLESSTRSSSVGVPLDLVVQLCWWGKQARVSAQERGRHHLLLQGQPLCVCEYTFGPFNLSRVLPFSTLRSIARRCSSTCIDIKEVWEGKGFFFSSQAESYFVGNYCAKLLGFYCACVS